MNEKMSEGCRCLMLWPSCNTAGNSDGKKQQPWENPGQWSVVSDTVLLIVRENRGGNGRQDEGSHPNGVFKPDSFTDEKQVTPHGGHQRRAKSMGSLRVVRKCGAGGYDRLLLPADEEVEKLKMKERLRISPNI